MHVKSIARGAAPAVAFVAVAALGVAATAQDVEIGWALHPGEEANAGIDYFAPEDERQTGVRVVGEILPPDQLRDQMAIEAIGGTGRWHLGYHSPGW